MPPATTALTRAAVGAVVVSAAVAGVFYAGAAVSGVDGYLSAGEYGARPAVQVGYNPAAPDGDLSTPASGSRYVAYDTYLRSDGGFTYGLFQARPDLGGTPAGSFASLYFDLDPANNNGSDLGFEIGDAVSAFVPGMSGGANLPDVAVARSGDGLTLEFAIPTSLLSGPIAGLDYRPGQTFPMAGDLGALLPLSQGFGYPVANGPTYAGGPTDLGDPLGRVAALATDVPEPASGALLLAGLAGARVAGRRRAAGQA